MEDQRDNKPLEKEAKDHISKLLRRSGFLVADPYFDIKGSDLIILFDLEKKIKIGIIQSKGRTVKKDQPSNVRIPQKYIKDNFIVFVYVIKEYNPVQEEYVYCFFEEDINNWTKNKKDFVLNIPVDFNEKDSFKEKLYSTNIGEKIKVMLKPDDNIIMEYLNELDISDKALGLWYSEGLIPSLDHLQKIYYSSEDGISTIEQAILIYISAFLKRTELEIRMDEFSENLSFEYLFQSIANFSNTENPIISEQSYVSKTSLEMGFNDWYGPYNKFLVGFITLKIEQRNSYGVYCFVYDSEGDGLEMFLPRNKYENVLIRFVSHLSKDYKDQILKILNNN
jgi:hypothetical protein